MGLRTRAAPQSKSWTPLPNDHPLCFLDRRRKAHSISFMNGHWWLALVLWLTALPTVRAQNIHAGSVSANKQSVGPVIQDAVDNSSPTNTNAVVSKLVVGGPLVQPFKSKGLRDLPKRLFHWVNPFAPTEPRVAYESTPKLSTRAWSTTVGWNPGGSAFPDPVTHEATMSLVSFGRTP